MAYVVDTSCVRHYCQLVVVDYSMVYDRNDSLTMKVMAMMTVYVAAMIPVADANVRCVQYH